MSREISVYRRANRTVACPRCGAHPGQPCRTPRGHATYEHGARNVSTAFRIGIEGGLSVALNTLDGAADIDEARAQIARQHEVIRRGNLRREADR